MNDAGNLRLTPFDARALPLIDYICRGHGVQTTRDGNSLKISANCDTNTSDDTRAFLAVLINTHVTQFNAAAGLFNVYMNRVQSGQIKLK